MWGIRTALWAAVVGVLAGAALALFPVTATNPHFADRAQAGSSLSCGQGWGSTPIGIITGPGPGDPNLPQGAVGESCRNEAGQRLGEAGVVAGAALIGGCWLAWAGGRRVHDLSERTTELLEADLDPEGTTGGADTEVATQA